MADYRVVFDVASQGYVGWHSAVPSGIMALGTGLLAALAGRSGANRDELPRSHYRMVAGSAALIASLGCVAIVVHTWKEFHTLRTALVTGSARLVEGDVRGFVPESSEGHSTEHFQVGDTRFEYSSNDSKSAFNWTAGKGGPMKEGLVVRILEVDGAIARLEIKQ